MVLFNLAKRQTVLFLLCAHTFRSVGAMESVRIGCARLPVNMANKAIKRQSKRHRPDRSTSTTQHSAHFSLVFFFSRFSLFVSSLLIERLSIADSFSPDYLSLSAFPLSLYFPLSIRIQSSMSPTFLLHPPS